MKIYKFYTNDINNIPKMGILEIYRKSLMLLKTFPSVKKDELKVAFIEQFRNNKNLKDKKSIDECISDARNYLRHLYTYESARRQLLNIPLFRDKTEENNYYIKYKNNLSYSNFDKAIFNMEGIISKQNKKNYELLKEDKNYDFF